MIYSPQAALLLALLAVESGQCGEGGALPLPLGVGSRLQLVGPSLLGRTGDVSVAGTERESRSSAGSPCAVLASTAVTALRGGGGGGAGAVVGEEGGVGGGWVGERVGAVAQDAMRRGEESLASYDFEGAVAAFTKVPPLYSYPPPPPMCVRVCC